MVGKRLRASARAAACTAALAAGAVVATPAVADAPSGLTLGPAAAVNPAGTNHVVSAKLVDPATGAALSGVAVRFVVQPASDAFPCGSTNAFACAGALLVGTCTTNVEGRCGARYVGPRLPREDVVGAYADLDGDAQHDAAEPLATVTSQWVGYASTAGKSTGGGRAAAVAFAFNAKSSNRRLSGTCNVRDAESEIRIRCLDVEAYVQIGRRSTFVGRATIDGDPTTYRIDVTDNGEPGRARDVFLLQTGSGFMVGGVVTQGNIQVH